MIDHLMFYPTEGDMQTELGAIGRANGSPGRPPVGDRYMKNHAEGGWLHNPSYMTPTSVITAEAVWDISDPESPFLVTPEVKLPGTWMWMSLPEIDTRMRDSTSLFLAIDRDTNTELYRDARLPDGRISPIFAGSAVATTAER